MDAAEIAAKLTPAQKTSLRKYADGRDHYYRTIGVTWGVWSSLLDHKLLAGRMTQHISDLGRAVLAELDKVLP